MYESYYRTQFNIPPTVDNVVCRREVKPFRNDECEFNTPDIYYLLILIAGGVVRNLINLFRQPAPARKSLEPANELIVLSLT